MPLTIDDLQDLVRLVETHPEWRATLRHLVLTEELLSLPAQIATLTDRVTSLAEAQQRTEVQVATLTDRVTSLAEAQQRTEVQVASLVEAQQRTEARLAAMTFELQTLNRDVGILKGKSLEADYRAKGHAYFSRVVRRPHVLTSDEITYLVDEARERGFLSEEDAHSLYAADVLVRGKRAADGREVYLVVEVSWSVDPHDVERAVQRAEILTHIGVEVIPVVAGELLTADAGILAHRHKVWQLTNGHTIPPSSAFVA
jgi:hypothetical protein